MTAPRNPSLTAEDVGRFLCFDGQHLYWRINKGSAKQGQRAGRLLKGYLCITLNRHHLAAHRVVWLLVHGKWPDGEIDHINRDRTDNRSENLRLASGSQNSANRRALGASGIKGVTLHKCGRWQVYCGSTYLGLYPTAEQAAAAYDAEAKKRYGEFAAVNLKATAGEAA